MTPPLPALTEVIRARITQLQEQYKQMHKYLRLKMDEDDMHGVIDAAMDMRDIAAGIDALKRVLYSEEVRGE